MIEFLLVILVIVGMFALAFATAAISYRRRMNQLLASLDEHLRRKLAKEELERLIASLSKPIDPETRAYLDGMAPRQFKVAEIKEPRP